MSFSNEWDEIYNNNLQHTSWPWSDLVSLVYLHCSIAISRNGVVFELGCSAGSNIPFIQSLGMDYYGVDGSKSVVKKLHQKFPELKERVIVGDFTQKDCFSRLPKILIPLHFAGQSCRMKEINDLCKPYGLLY